VPANGLKDLTLRAFSVGQRKKHFYTLAGSISAAHAILLEMRHEPELLEAAIAALLSVGGRQRQGHSGDACRLGSKHKRIPV
jgi:hypothetical protein